MKINYARKQIRVDAEDAPTKVGICRAAARRCFRPGKGLRRLSSNSPKKTNNFGHFERDLGQVCATSYNFRNFLYTRCGLRPGQRL